MKPRTCPNCKGAVSAVRPEVLPFCSAECKLVDLGRWLDGSYRVPSEDIPTLDPGTTTAELGVVSEVLRRGLGADTEEIEA